MKSRKVYPFFLFLLFCIQLGQAQSNKHLFEISASGSYGLGSILTGQSVSYNENENTFDIRNSQYNLRSNLRYTYLANKRFGFGLSLTHQRFNNFRPAQFLINPGDLETNIYLEFVESMTFDMIAPLITFKYTKKHSLIPFGVEHTWGIGPAFYRLVDKPYRATYSAGTYDQETGSMDVTVNDELLGFQKYNGLNISYDIDLNFPISLKQFISLGLEFYTNFVFLKSEVMYPNNSLNTLEDWLSWSYFSANQSEQLRQRMG